MRGRVQFVARSLLYFLYFFIEAEKYFALSSLSTSGRLRIFASDLPPAGRRVF